jgi:hypothetical protein
VFDCAHLLTKYFYTVEANDIEEKRKSQRVNKIKGQANLECKQSQYLRSRWSGNAENGANKTGINNQETAVDSDTQLCCWDNYVQTTKEADWIECVSCRNRLHEFCCPYKDKVFDCGRSCCERNTASVVYCRLQPYR